MIQRLRQSDTQPGKSKSIRGHCGSSKNRFYKPHSTSTQCSVNSGYSPVLMSLCEPCPPSVCSWFNYFTSICSIISAFKKPVHCPSPVSPFGLSDPLCSSEFFKHLELKEALTVLTEIERVGNPHTPH